jgi:hypothetical protein
VNLVFDHDDPAAVCLAINQLVGRLKLHVVAIALETGHQIGASFDDARPTGKVVEEFVDDIVRDVEEVFTITCRVAPLELDRSKA